MTEEEIIAAARKHPPEAQRRIHDAIREMLPKPRRGRPPAVGPTPNFVMKLEAKEVFAALSSSNMSEIEKLRVTEKAVPGLGPGVIERLCRNEDSYFRRVRRKAGEVNPDFMHRRLESKSDEE